MLLNVTTSSRSGNCAWELLPNIAIRKSDEANPVGLV